MTNRPGDFEVPELSYVDSKLTLNLPTYFRDKAYANYVGQFQQKIQEIGDLSNKLSAEVVFDFRNCRWIDPLPLMSILIEIISARKSKIRVKIQLPEPAKNAVEPRLGPYHKSPNRLLWFLNEEGFFNTLDEAFEDDEELQYPRKSDRHEYESIRVMPSYEDSRCIPLQAFSVPSDSVDDSFAQVTVENTLNGLNTKLESKVSPINRERLIYKLRAVLQEAIHNTQEHAYLEHVRAPVMAVYVRYRVGGANLSSGARPAFNLNLKREVEQCQKLEREWLETRDGCLEVFLLDRGVGIVKSFENSGKKLKNKYKFDEAMKRTFLAGESSKDERQTAYGGLHLLHNMMLETGDYIRGFGGSSWFGAATPIHRQTKSTHAPVNTECETLGLALHFRLGWKTETDSGEKWARFKTGKNSEIWSELDRSEATCAASFDWFEKQSVLDERFSRMHVEGKEGLWCLWLVKPHRMKWDILTFLEREVAPLLSKPTNLVIADIPSYEAETYIAALSKFSSIKSNDWPKYFRKIVLCTNRWRFAVLEYETSENRHGFSSPYEDFSRLKVKGNELFPESENVRLAIVRWIKWHDSKLIWREINIHQNMFIPEKVEWGVTSDGKAKPIDGYLDFSRAARHEYCAHIFRASLARVLGVMPSKNVKMDPLDLLTQTVLRDVHQTEVFEPATSPPDSRLAIGSVLVSGETLNRSLADKIVLHFLIHSSSSVRQISESKQQPEIGNRPSLLFWLPGTEIEIGKSNLSRIGKTATIGVDGWKSFEIPRFDKNMRLSGARSPKNTYEDWQNSYPVIVKSGHWTYQGHHDFVTINITSAVNAAFLEKNHLARFLLNQILPFLGLNQGHLRKDFSRLVPAFDFSSRLAENGGDYGLLVYRSHPSSESVIRNVLETLTEEGRALAEARVFPILPVRKRWSGSSLLIPPLVRQEIIEAIEPSTNSRPVLIFDDAAITGRTLHDLQAALSTMGAKRVSTVVIVNRMRQPSDLFGSERLNYYWRLDVPVMGRVGNCTLCHAIDLANGFTPALASSEAKAEVSGWINQWKEVSPIDNWNRGINPSPLSAPELKKNYCFRLGPPPSFQGGKYLSEIDVVRSTGVAIHVSEIHAMTGRDDYFFRKIKRHESPDVRIELAASQLLLFGDEFDAEIRIRMVELLVRETSKISDSGSHSQLAALVVIFGFSLLDEKGKKVAADIISQPDSFSRRSYSCRVLFSYLAKANLLDPASEAYKVGTRLLSANQLSLSSRLKAIYSETLSPLGNPHTEAIPSLLDNDLQFSDCEIQDAIDSLGHLDDLISNLDPSVARKNSRATLDSLKVEWLGKSSSLLQLLTKERLIRSPLVDRYLFNKIVSEYLESVKAIAGAYFHQIDSIEDYYKRKTFETSVLQPIIERIDWKRAVGKKIDPETGEKMDRRDRDIKLSHTGELRFHYNAQKVWVPWFQGIPVVFLDLFKNAVYSSGAIKDPWDSNSPETADMWVRVDYLERHVEIKLANRADIRPDELSTRLNSTRWANISGIGGCVSPIEIDGSDQQLAVLLVSIPYAAYLQS